LTIVEARALIAIVVFGRSRQKTRSDGTAMKNAINDEVILAARLFLATLFLIFGWRKLRDYSGTVRQMVYTPFGCPHGFIHAGNFAYRASLLDDDRRGSTR
jgi:hypothetical protein